MTYPKGFDVAVVNRGTQGQRIDWPVVGSAEEVDFCGIRLLDGTLKDSDADYNRSGASVINLPWFGYQAFYPWVDPVKQAVEAAATAKDSPYILAGDLEKSGGLAHADYIKIAKVYVNEYQQRAGRMMMIYTGPWFGSTYLGNTFSGNPLWIANPNSSPSLPSGWSKWVFWQYSWSQAFAGIADKTVDADYFNGTVEELKAFLGFVDAPPSGIEQRVERLEAAARAHGWTL